MGFIDNCMI